MRFGAPLSAGLGEPERHIQNLTASAMQGNSAVAVSFAPATNFGAAYFGIYINAVLQTEVWLDEGQQLNPTMLSTIGANGNISVTALRHGPKAGQDLSAVARYFDGQSSQAVTVAFPWALEVLGTPDYAYLDTWTFAGLPYAQAGRVDSFPSRGKLSVALSVVGSTATVTLSNLSQEVASGSGAFPGTVNFVASNSSGVSGSVNVLAGAAPI